MTSVKSKRIEIIAALSLACSACSGDRPNFEHALNPAVASKCAPVQTLLGKNYERTRRVDAVIVSVEEQVKYTGAILAADDAMKAVRADALCKAWANGAISDSDYASQFLAIFIDANLPPTANAGNEIDFDQILQRVEQLEDQKLLPEGQDLTNLRSLIEATSKLDWEKRSEALDSRYGNLSAKIGSEAAERMQLRRDLLAEIQALRAEMATNEDSGADQDGAHATSIITSPFPVYFSTNSSELTASAKTGLLALTRKIVSDQLRVKITGHTDPRGSAALNAALASDRAQAVSDFLLANRVVIDQSEGSLDRTELSSDFDKMRVAIVRW